MKKKDIYCPYCRAKARLTTFSEVYGEKATDPDEKIWVCGNFNKGCNAYVGTHKGTDKPFGQLANARLRRLRIDAHRAIDRVVEAGIMDKHTIYDYLETSFGFRRGKFHLGNSGEYYCQETIGIMNKILHNNAKGEKRK